MKKVLFVLAVAMLGVMASSCAKNQTCKCTEYYQGMYEDSGIYDTEAEGLKKCSELTDRLNMRYAGGGYTYECTKL